MGATACTAVFGTDLDEAHHRTLASPPDGTSARDGEAPLAEEAGTPIVPGPVPPGPDGTCAADRKKCDQLCVSLRDPASCAAASCAACTGVTHGARAPAGLFRQISAVVLHTCGVKNDGSVTCWGRSSSGECTPAAGTYRHVGAGADFTCGVKTDGSVACWGKHDYAQSTPPAGAVQ